jgi:hypothetical protein
VSVVAFPGASTESDDVGPDGLWELIARIAGQLNLLHARMVDLTAHAIATDGWSDGTGVRSVEHWLSLRAGLSPSSAAHVATLARNRDRLPVLSSLVAQGRLSLEQAATVARRVPAAYEESVCEIAPLLTVSQLRRIVSRYPFDPDPGPEGATAGVATTDGGTPDATPPGEATTDSGTPDATPPGEATADSGTLDATAGAIPPSAYAMSPAEAQQSGTPTAARAGTAAVEPLTWEQQRRLEPSRMSLHWDDDRLILRGDFDAVDGALIETALREAKDALFTSGETDATLADALTEACTRSLATVESPSRAALYRIYLHLDTEGAWLNARGTLVHHLATRLGCTADTAAVWHTEGRPVSVGRTRTAIPAHTRRLVADRDRGCAYPGCTSTRFVEIHHILHRQDGGGHDYDNLISLCPHHHTAHHAGAFEIVRSTNTYAPFRFTTPRGHPISVTPPRPRPQSLPEMRAAPSGHAGRRAPAWSAGTDLARDTSDASDAVDTGDSSHRLPDAQGHSADTSGGHPHDSEPAVDTDQDDAADTAEVADVAPSHYQPPLGERLDTNWITFRKRTPAPRPDGDSAPKRDPSPDG